MNTTTAAIVGPALSAGKAWAKPQAGVNLFQNPGKKQTDEDFKPAPAKIETNFGSLGFINGAYPDEESTQRIYDEMDLQRATQAYMDFYPAMSLHAIVSSQIRDFGLKTSSDFAVMADYLTPTEFYLTGNDITVYAVASLDLKVDGPTVVEIPPGMMGTANDAAFKYLADFGAVGLDMGQGGRYLFLPPDHEGGAIASVNAKTGVAVSGVETVRIELRPRCARGRLVRRIRQHEYIRAAR